jgi:predicted RNA-binding Zn ribbon-like protein
MITGYGPMISRMGERQQAPGNLELVRTFVNTLDLDTEEERLTDADALRAWLIENGLAGEGVQVRPSDLRRALGLREALRATLLTHNGETAEDPHPVETLEATATRARVRLHFDPAGGSRLAPDAGGVDGALGRLLVIVHEAIADHTWERLKACRDHGCAWAFYDATRNHSRTWCDMQSCGNRAKARAYRNRQVS